MEKEELLEYKKKLQQLSYEENVKRDLYLRDIALGKLYGPTTGFPSIDKPWLKYYKEEQILAPLPRNLSAYNYLRLLNNNNLNSPAIEFLNKQITYLELFKKINDTTKSLHALGVKPKDIVTVMLPACPYEAYLFYAIDQIGACANFVFPGTPLEEVNNIMTDFHSTKLFIFNNMLLQPNSLVNRNDIDIVSISFDEKSKIQGNNILSWEQFDNLKYTSEMPIYNRNENEPLFIAKTGGSTGKPKSVVLSDKSFNLQVHQHLNTSQKYDIGDRWLRLWPLFSASAAVSSNHLPLCAGMLMIIEPNFEINKMDEIVLKHKPSHMPFIASGLDVIIQSPLMQTESLSFMKSIGVGGEAITPEFENRANAFLQKHNIESCVRIGYGMTENGSGAAARFNEKTNKLGSTGVPQLNTIISIFNPDTSQELKYGNMGEICVISDSHMLGYYNDTEKTKTVLKKHDDNRVWLHSGDIGYMDKEGFLFVTGRLKRVISLYSANKVFPLDLEKIIETIEGIEKAVVVPENDIEHPGYVVPSCFVITHKNYSENELLEIINENCLKNHPSYNRINSVHIRKELPHTQIGKIDLKLLEEESMKLSKQRIKKEAF